MQGHILLVDDEPTIIRFLQKALDGRGYNTDSAENGALALAKITANRPDLLITDVMMPEMDGFELLTAIREDSALSSLPVIMLAAMPADLSRDDPEFARRYLHWDSTGLLYYITKPLRTEELIQAVESVLPSP